MSTVKLYLDVDGVVNLFPKKGENKSGWDSLSRGKVSQFHITWAPDMIEALRGLGVELVWTTMWMEWAPQHLSRLIGYGSEARYLVPLGEGQPQWPTILWKHKAVHVDQLEKPSPFIWLDDEMSREQRLWAESMGGLAIRTNETQGITPDIVALMREYVAKHTESEVSE
ncbi:phosphatase [Microbacterium phage Pumpernickel]|uniref:Phosphatase n=1 Tax=Microbacterium phage Pumpernickel TaxID=2885983 RepID=A0AAE8Y8N1_9CAUD|nr:phosphatase [Microbacterium phage Pumpernickel]UDL15966.1 phosphatase [Microbacterium phage Pumpernickel]